ncbi:MAG TPA: ribosome biogenesis GTPase Der [Thermodesulfobacteriota bacterium]|nr:ribosome biogenesis GTPase Der [Thermodesulfobacteriota bacterium]
MRRMIAIVGSPNVGKSTLFNRLTHKQKAIIEDIPGVTRDRNYADIAWDNHAFTVIDTGGFEPDATEKLSRLVFEQAQVAIDEADIIIFLADGRRGLMPVDRDLVQFLRSTSKPVFYCINKIDGVRHEETIPDFYQLGVEGWFAISAQHGRGVSDLMDAIVEMLPHEGEEAAAEESVVVKIAVVGRPNVGKSSLVNKILGYERVIVSDIPGTTRDAVDTPVEYQGKRYLIIDTAGLRRKSRIGYQLEKYCVVEALKALSRCDVSLIVIDAEEGITDQDVKIAGQVYNHGKACILVVNKWDRIEKDNETPGIFVRAIKDKAKFLDFASILFVSALSGQRVTRILEKASECYVQYCRRIDTGDLNRFVEQAGRRVPAARFRGKPIKFYYATQVAIKPPTFVFFVNYPKAVHFSYERYLMNQLREAYGFEGTPLRIYFRGRTRGQKDY